MILLFSFNFLSILYAFFCNVKDLLHDTLKFLREFIYGGPNTYLKMRDLRADESVVFVSTTNSKIFFSYKQIVGAWKSLFDTAETIIPNYDPEAVLSLTKFVDQLPSVFGELAQGISEFKPKPPENLECFKKSYNIERTLLVKFNFDTIDETDLLEETLQQRVESIGGKLEKVTLSGTHLTPCIPEPRWQVGSVYTPADAIAQGLKTVSLNDTKVLCRTIVDWLSNLE
ncbi:hypothetical protein Leryth_010499 [Lithospermum erythrorhizon]|nr:hypothetical protein Leryth_010499 [Lithospermum erythrorhizon]